MRLFGTIMLVLLALAGPAWADEPAECRVVEHLVQNPFPLPRASKALEAKRLDILVLGGESSMLPGASESKAYPSRLQNVLAQKLPNIDIKVTVRICLPEGWNKRTALVLGFNKHPKNGVAWQIRSNTF